MARAMAVDVAGDVAPDGAEQTAALARITTWARGLSGAEGVLLTCSGGLAPTTRPGEHAVRLPGCLATVDEASLAELVAAAPRLRLVPGPCCGGPSAAAEHLVDLLAVLGVPGRLDLTEVGGGGPVGDRPSSTTDDLPVSRRQLFAWARRTPDPLSDNASRGDQRTPTTDRRAPTPRRSTPMADRYAPTTDRRAPTPPTDHGEAQQQVRLVAALRELVRQGQQTPQTREPATTPGAAAGGPETAPAGRATSGARPVTSSARPAPHGDGPPAPRALHLDSSGCTACGTCVRACPTRALDLAVEPAPGEPGDGIPSARLLLETAACIGCERCLALCPVDALSAGPALDWAALTGSTPVRTLETVQVRPCARCRTPFAGEGDLCQVCRMRQQNPFGSWLPPGLVAPHVYAPPAPDLPDPPDPQAG